MEWLVLISKEQWLAISVICAVILILAFTDV